MPLTRALRFLASEEQVDLRVAQHALAVTPAILCQDAIGGLVRKATTKPLSDALRTWRTTSAAKVSSVARPGDRFAGAKQLPGAASYVLAWARRSRRAERYEDA